MYLFSLLKIKSQHLETTETQRGGITHPRSQTGLMPSLLTLLYPSSFSSRNKVFSQKKEKINPTEQEKYKLSK